MNSILNLITSIRELEGPSRELDGQIHSLAQSLSPNVPSPSNRTPHYTNSVHANYELIRHLWPKEVCGVSWEPGRASVKLGDGDYVQHNSLVRTMNLAILLKISRASMER